MGKSLDYIKQICWLHAITKEYLIKCEEINQKTLLQPIKEYRDAYDHILRTFFKDDNDQNTLYDLEAALSHEFRAFVDTMDYFCMSMREKIFAKIQKLPPKSIALVLPNYEQMRLFIVNSFDEITEIRLQRDSWSRKQVVEKYCCVANQMYQYFKEVFCSSTV